jgi:hypothetical protein
MAVIRVFEYGRLPDGATTRERRPRAKDEVTIAAASDQANAFTPETKFVTIQADAACHVAFGADPTATTADFKIQSGASEDFHVIGGHKVAVIQA